MAVAERNGAVDFAFLEGFLAGDKALVMEVLAVFRGQAAGWPAKLTPDNPDWRALAHTIKGGARGIGANALGDAAHRAEVGDPEELAGVRVALEAAMADIAAYEAQAG